MLKNKWVLSAVGILGASLVIAWVARSPGTAEHPEPSVASARSELDPAAQTLALTAEDFQQFKVMPAVDRVFSIQREAVGAIDFNQEMSTDVFPPVQGKILKLFVSAGDDVAVGAPLYTIDSPDLVQAGSNLISAAGVLDLTTRALKRAKELREVEGISQRDYDQAVSDQQGAEAASKAARDAVRIFGKTDKEIDEIVAQRKIDPVLVVRSPLTGRVTGRNAAPGVLVQPGNPPAPLTIADLSTMWMLADVAESDFGLLRLGQPVDVCVRAYSDRVFHGSIVNIGASVDPSSRRVAVRSVISDPKHELRAGMFATFVIQIGEARSPAVPQNGVIREGDGTTTIWVTADRQKIVRRTVKTGLRQGGFVQILEGLTASEMVATESALFLSNAFTEGDR